MTICSRCNITISLTEDETVSTTPDGLLYLCQNCSNEVCPHCGDDIDFHLDNTCPEDPAEKLKQQYAILFEPIIKQKFIDVAYQMEYIQYVPFQTQ